MAISESSAKRAGGKYMTRRYEDLISQSKEKKQITESGKQIASNIIGNLKKAMI